MLFVEEFKVKPDKLGEVEKFIETALKAVNELTAPYLKSVKIYNSIDDFVYYIVQTDIMYYETLPAGTPLPPVRSLALHSRRVFIEYLYDS